MTHKNIDIHEKYFQWMCRMVISPLTNISDHSELLRCLDDIPFRYSIEMDENRAEDGIDLRYRFGAKNHIPDAIIATKLDIRECSVLEMMIALAIRCEEHIMEDVALGNRTSVWFWNMINSLGLFEMSDYNFDEERVRQTICTFLDRKFKKNGEGSIFTVHRHKADLRKIEIWYQMMMYLEEL